MFRKKTQTKQQQQQRRQPVVKFTGEGFVIPFSRGFSEEIGKGHTR